MRLTACTQHSLLSTSRQFHWRTQHKPSLAPADVRKDKMPRKSHFHLDTSCASPASSLFRTRCQPRPLVPLLPEHPSSAPATTPHHPSTESSLTSPDGLPAAPRRQTQQAEDTAGARSAADALQRPWSALELTAKHVGTPQQG